MIDRKEFLKAWQAIEERFGRTPDPKMAAMYLAFLTEQMETAEFLAAARTIWATAKFWPRPADFLTLGPAGEWPIVVRCIDGFRAPDWPWVKPGPDGELSPWHSLSERSRAACRQMGGMDVLKATYERDPIRAKTEWERALEQTTADAVLQLAATGTFRTLPPAA